MLPRTTLPPAIIRTQNNRCPKSHNRYYLLPSFTGVEGETLVVVVKHGNNFCGGVQICAGAMKGQDSMCFERNGHGQSMIETKLAP